MNVAKAHIQTASRGDQGIWALHASTLHMWNKSIGTKPARVKIMCNMTIVLPYDTVQSVEARRIMGESRLQKVKKKKKMRTFSENRNKK